MTPYYYITQHSQEIIQELFSLMRIPSISADSAYHTDILRCAEQWSKLLQKSGLSHVAIMPTAGNPVVYGEYLVDPLLPTVLVYAHYDVMPVGDLDLWTSSPFDPEIRDGYIYGRGADDDKGQAMIQLKGFETALACGTLRCNVKFLIEGEEEIGSSSLEKFCIANKELLKCDVIAVSDTSMVGKQTPSITTGLRGLAYWQVEVVGPNRDLHSGHFGGAVANPINELCRLIASVTDDKGRITIPHFYDRVADLSPMERDMLAAVPFDKDAYCKAIGISAVQGEEGYSTLERNAVRPAFDVCGIWGGYMGEGSKTVIPSKATAKLSCRLVPHQDHHEIAQLMEHYLQQQASPAVKVFVTHLHGGQGYVCPIDLPAYKAAADSYQKVFGQPPLAVRRGGSIPIISTFEKILGVKTVLMGFGLESNAIHSPNERMEIALMMQGIEVVAEFFERIGSVESVSHS